MRRPISARFPHWRNLGFLQNPFLRSGSLPCTADTGRYLPAFSPAPSVKTDILPGAGSSWISMSPSGVFPGSSSSGKGSASSSDWKISSAWGTSSVKISSPSSYPSSRFSMSPWISGGSSSKIAPSSFCCVSSFSGSMELLSAFAKAENDPLNTSKKIKNIENICNRSRLFSSYIISFHQIFKLYSFYLDDIIFFIWIFP